LNVFHTHISYANRNFVVICSILTCLKHHMPKTSTSINLVNLQRFIMNDGMYNYSHRCQVNCLQFFTNVSAQCKKVNLFNKNKNWTTMDCLIVLLISNNPTTICNEHPSYTQKINNQNKSIYTTLKHPKIKTNKNYYCKCMIQKNMSVHCFFGHGEQHFFYKRRPKKKLNTRALVLN
jgi:hypothetical protein